MAQRVVLIAPYIWSLFCRFFLNGTMNGMLWIPIYKNVLISVMETQCPGERQVIHHAIWIVFVLAKGCKLWVFVHQ